MVLRVENLTKDFPNTRAVNELSFELGESSICGFVGPNGAGKTTTMRIIATLEEPSAGRVWIEGMPIDEEPYRVRRRIGFMPDHYGSYPALTVEDYLEFYARAYEVDAKVRPRRIGQIMDFTGLDRIRDKEVETLSKGMRQRLNLGRALINDPKLLVMDEPAAGLDPRARVELRYLIRALAEQGKTVFVSSHILTELGEMCDSLLIIDKGRSITFGSFEQIQSGLQEGFDIAVRLTLVEKAEALERFLAERPDIENIRVDEGGRLRFSFSGEETDIPPLMREMLNADFPLIEFRPQTLTMEDVFIQITEGEFGDAPPRETPPDGNGNGRMNPEETLTRNAVLYKDITQWLRSRVHGRRHHLVPSAVPRGRGDGCHPPVAGRVGSRRRRGAGYPQHRSLDLRTRHRHRRDHARRERESHRHAGAHVPDRSCPRSDDRRMVHGRRSQVPPRLLRRPAVPHGHLDHGWGSTSGSSCA